MNPASQPSKTRKFTRFIVLFALLALVMGTIPAMAFASYDTYSYNSRGTWIMCPDAYVPESMITSQTIGLYYLRDKPLDGPLDMFVDYQMKLYFADTRNDRIVVLKADYSFDMIISTFVNEWGVPDSLSQPRGVFADEHHIYVADTAKSRLVVFTRDGAFSRIVAQPESEVFPENHVYTPIAVAVDKAGRIYVVSSTTFQGIITMGPGGDFQTFMGAQRSPMGAWQIFWRSFQSKEQRRRTIRNVSTEYNNITLDEDGFLYATTSSIPPGAQQAALRSKDPNFQPVKKFNPNGTDIMRRSGFYAPAGEAMAFAGSFAGNKGPSKIIDVAIGPEGTWSIIDENRSRIYTYDADGQCLFIFGDFGTQFGTIQSIQAIEYQGEKMLVLDKNTSAVTIYKRTEYGDVLIGQAIKNHNERMYDQATADWKEILKRNNNFDLAYIGIGKSYYREGYYIDAMEQFRYAMDLKLYSDAFREYRKMWIEDYVLVIPLVIAAVLVGVGMFMKNAKKVNTRDQIREGRKLKFSSHMLYGFHIIFHPFDGFWDMKHEKRGSVTAATTYLALTCLAFGFQSVGTGFIFSGYGGNFMGPMVGTLVPVALWCIANWCLTTLFDGEGSLKDIYMVTCYSLLPLVMLLPPATLLTNVVTRQEIGIVEMLPSIAWIWLGLLVFFGIMVVHDYSLGKNIVTMLGTVVGAAFIIFVLMLFSSLLLRMVSFVNGIYLELLYRM